MIFSKHILNNYLPKLLFLSLLASTAFAYSGGTGQPNDPYQIADTNDLLALAAAPADYNKCFILTADVNMAGQVFTTAIIAPAGAIFNGIFDGSGHSILNLTINEGWIGNDYLGLFGRIGAGGIVKNLGIENVIITFSESCEGSRFVGGLCGASIDSNIINCYSTGNVSGDYGGGLCGQSNYCNISNCFSTAKVAGNGGFCGYSINSNISNCYSTGQVSGGFGTGGFCGYSIDSNISNCYSTGQVTGYDDYTGGLCGHSEYSTLSNCYSTGSVTGEDNETGGLCGYSIDSNISDCYSTGQVTGIYNTCDIGGLCGSSIDSNIINCYSTGQVSGGNINTGGLCGYSEQSNISGCFSTGSVTGEDFDTGGLCGPSPASNISHCYSTGSVTGGDIETGGLCGGNHDWHNIFSIGSIRGSITNCYSTGNVSGDRETGGLCGYNDGGITNCYSTGTVVSVYSGYDYSSCGGLVGINRYGNISNCYSTGTVSGNSYVGGLAGETYNGSISNCYSIGAVVGDSNVGGLVGYSYSSTTNNSFWDVNTSGQTTSAGGTGKTTTEMKTLSTFTSAGWDFSYTDGDKMDWFIQIDEYPILTWQISPVDIYTDGKNNFRDFAILAQFWMRDDCRGYNYFCDGADLNSDGVVDIHDLKKFISYWLQSGIYE